MGDFGSKVMSTSIVAIIDGKYSCPTYNPNYCVPKILFSNLKPLTGPYRTPLEASQSPFKKPLTKMKTCRVLKVVVFKFGARAREPHTHKTMTEG